MVFFPFSLIGCTGGLSIDGWMDGQARGNDNAWDERSVRKRGENPETVTVPIPPRRFTYCIAQYRTVLHSILAIY